MAGAGTFTLGGYSDWRLPTIKELYSLIDFSGVDPSGYEGIDTSGLIPFIDTDYFDFAYGDTDTGERIIDSQYASSNLYVDESAGGLLFGVNFADGRIKGYGLSFMGNDKTFFVIYVRGNTEYGQNDFTDNSDGTITDKATGLMWSQDDSGTALNWEEALAWAQTKNSENYLGYSDWRLPNVKELQSIVDYTCSPGTSGSAAIDPLFNATAIVNEAGETDYPFYWSGTTHANWSAVAGGFGAYVAFGRAMGYMDDAWVDVHGAGAQRSDPKSGNPADYPTGNGPQGDAIRIYNHVRLVRDAATYAVVDTGQVACYDADGVEISCPETEEDFYGQDAQYEGTQMSFQDNGDGTVTDLNTGLMWQQTPPSDGYSKADSVTYCENLELAGYDDWRLPTLKELFAIGNYSEGWPYLDETYFDIAGETVSKDEQFWAQENYVGVSAESGSSGAWGVNHGTGHIKTYPSGAGPGGGKRVRAVRGTITAINNYTDNGDGTITDNATGLMWSQADNGVGMLWADALAYAENSELAGYDDWRLPNIKELQSIVDYSYSPTATDPDAVGPAIDPIFDCTPIINEAGNDDYPYFWSSTSARFRADTDFYYAWYVAFGMAVDPDGQDFHGAGAVRFDTKALDGPAGEDAARSYNYVRCVRSIK